VKPQQVVLQAEFADLCLRFYTAVRPMPVVSVQPDRAPQRGGQVWDRLLARPIP